MASAVRDPSSGTTMRSIMFVLLQFRQEIGSKSPAMGSQGGIDGNPRRRPRIFSGSAEKSASASRSWRERTGLDGPVLLEQAELLHPVVDLIAGHPEQLPGLRLVPVGPFEGLEDDVLLELVELDPLG